MAIADDIILDFTGIEENHSELTLQQVDASPNPFTQITHFTFKLPRGTEYRIELFDVLGRQVRTISGTSSGEAESVVWNRKDERGTLVGAGVYLYRFKSSIVNKFGKVVVR